MKAFQFAATFAQDSGSLSRAGARVTQTTGAIEHAWGTQARLHASAPVAQLATEALCATLIGRPSWRDTELARIQREESPAAALAKGQQRYGDEVIAQLGGRFVALVWQPSEGRGWAALDRLGQDTLYWTRQADSLLISDSLSGILANLAHPPEITAQGIFNYTFFHMQPSPDGIYQGVHKLRAAHRLTFTLRDQTVEPYWLPSFSDGRLADPAEQHREFHEVFAEAVRQCRGDNDKFGAFLSGGLDSSTVAGHLAKQMDAPPDTYTIGFEAGQYDEREFSRTANQHFGCIAHEYVMQAEDVVDALPKVAAHYDEPFGNSSALAAYFCAKLAKDEGKELLIAGDGGDELFAGNERYAKQLVFEHWFKLPGPMRGLTRGLVGLLPGFVPLANKARSYIDQADLGLPDRLQSYNFLHRIDPAEVFDGDLLAQTDLAQPARLERELYNLPDDAHIIDRMLYLDWQHTLADNDIRKVSGMCDLAGIEVAYPFLTDQVVEFSTRIPATEKLKDGKLRHFYKEAMRGFLPDKIIDKSKHGFGLPFGLWLSDHPRLRELAADNLASLAKRGYFQTSFIEKARDLHKNQHAAYYGELIWVLVVLELWLASRGN